MADQINDDFARRIAAYQHNLKKGQVFVADGTLGGLRSKPARPAWRGSFSRKILKFLIFAMMIKAVLFHGARTLGFDASDVDLRIGATLPKQFISLILYPDQISLSVHRWMQVAEQYLAIEVRKRQ